MIVSMRDTRVVTVLLMDALGELNSMPGQPACGRRAASTPASAHDMPALGVRRRRARFASIHRTAKQTDAERKFAHSILRNRAVLAYSFHERAVSSRRGLS